MQKMNEHGKTHETNTSRGNNSLPAKEFRAILVKMIKNLENKMEEQINRLEAQIKNILEMFHKDLE